MRSFVRALILALAAVVGSHAFVMAPARAGLSPVSLREGSFVSSLPSTASLTVAQGASNVAAPRQR